MMNSKILTVLVGQDPVKFLEVRSLTSTEYNNFKKAELTLMQAQSKLELFQFVDYNFREYERGIEISLEKFVHDRKNPFLFDNISTTLNLRLSNYLFSVRLLLDHSEHNLKKTFNKDSPIVKKFLKECSNAYDSNFSYRFLYRLRNYVQHCGMPISIININSTVPDNDPSKISYTLELKFDRDNLLKNFNWKSLTPEIKKLPPLFDVNPHIYGMNKSIGDITFALIKNELKYYNKCSKYLKTLLIECLEVTGSPSSGYPCILDSMNLRPDGGNFNIIRFPLHLINLVDNFNSISIKKSDKDNTPKKYKNPTIIVSRSDKIKSNIFKGKNNIPFSVPENAKLCSKCGGPLGFYFKKEKDITGKEYNAECFGCLQCKKIIP